MISFLKNLFLYLVCFLFGDTNCDEPTKQNSIVVLEVKSTTETPLVYEIMNVANGFLNKNTPECATIIDASTVCYKELLLHLVVWFNNFIIK